MSAGRYEQLIQDLKSEYRPQREWVDGRGVFLVIGHFLVGVAAGTWLFGLIFDSPASLAVAFFVGGAGGLSHLAYLGRPERAWKMVLHARTSWIARGFFGLSAFLVGGFLYLVPLLLPGAPWALGSFLADAGYVLALIGMVILIFYMGFVYSASKGVPFWNSPIHPALYIAYACRGGIAVLLVTMALAGQGFDPGAGLLELWMAVTAVVIVLWLLELQGAASSGNLAARRSVRDLLAGRVARYFYGGTLVVGFVVPAILMTGVAAPLSVATVAVIGLASVIGDFFMKYSSIKAGVYLPLRARHPFQRA